MKIFEKFMLNVFFFDETFDGQTMITWLKEF